MKQDPDRELVLAVKADRPGAHKRLFDRFWLPVLRMAHTWFLNRHDAEDAAIEALNDVFQGIGKFEGRSTLSTWVYRVAWNRLAHVHRKQGRELDTVSLADAAEPETDATDPAQQHDQRTEFLDLMAAILKLPGEQGQAIMLCDLVGLDQDEAARVLGLRPAALRKRLSRGRQALRSNKEVMGDERTG